MRRHLYVKEREALSMASRLNRPVAKSRSQGLKPEGCQPRVNTLTAVLFCPFLTPLARSSCRVIEPSMTRVLVQPDAGGQLGLVDVTSEAAIAANVASFDGDGAGSLERVLDALPVNSHAMPAVVSDPAQFKRTRRRPMQCEDAGLVVVLEVHP